MFGAKTKEKTAGRALLQGKVDHNIPLKLRLCNTTKTV